MPSGKHREFDDTWKKEELEKSLKGSKDDKRRSKGKDSDKDNHRDKDKSRRRDDDGRRRREHDENGDVDRKSSKSSRDKDEAEKKHRSKEKEDRHSSNREHGDKEREHEDRNYKDKNQEQRDRDHRNKDREQRDIEHRDRNRDRDRERDQDHGEKDREHRDRDRDRKEKDREHRDRDRDHKENDREHRDRDRDRKEKDREHRDKNRDRDRDRKDKDRENRDKNREHRNKEEERDYRERGDQEHRNSDRRSKDRDYDDRDRAHRSSKDRNYREKDYEADGGSRHDRDRSHHNIDDSGEYRTHKNDSVDEAREKKSRRKDETDEERRRRKEKEQDRDRRHRDEKDRKDDERRSRHRDDDDEERRKRHEEKKKQREREKEREKEREREEENERQRQKDKERAEREKKEKQRKEREKEKSQQQSKKQEEEEEADEYGEYEEDFEDYDDDFEEDEDEGASKKSNSEVDEVMRAMNEENDRLLQQSKTVQPQTHHKSRRFDRHSSNENDEYEYSKPAPRSTQPTFINFVSAKQREISSKAASKTVRRAKELKQLIELDVARFDIFDMPPVNEYELYMRSFGSSNTRQAYVQSNEDNIERDIQTEEIETKDIWVQNTPEAIENVGGPGFEKESADSYLEQSPQEAFLSAQRWERLLNATLILLEEDAAEMVQQNSQSGGEGGAKHSNICLSEAFMELNTCSLGLFKGHSVIDSHFSPVQTNMLLTTHSSEQKPSESHSRKGMIAVWNVNTPHIPQKVLMCESLPRCCCFSPTKATLVFAGTHNGSVVVWDLREPADMHKLHKDGDIELVLQYPTYSTAGILQYENHQSAVIAIQPIVSSTDSTTEEDKSSSLLNNDGLSFQLATLEENSVINLWVVAEMDYSDPAGSEFDLGLSPGGRVKVVKSSTISLESPLRDLRLRTTMNAFDMRLLPSNNSHFYVATDTGCVIHGVRYGGKAPPRVFRGEIDSPVKITALDFSPFPDPVFLVGCEDGTLRLHHSAHEYPLITWPDTTGGTPIQAVRWCRSRPSVFFVLDAQSRMHIWDLLMSDAVPMKFEQIAQEKVTSIDLCNDHSATGIGLPGRKPQMAISLESGATEIHTLSGEFSALTSEEKPQFSRFLQTVT